MSFDYVLKHADVEDLDILTDYITDKGEGRISLDSDVCKRLVHCKATGSYELADRELIGKEIRAFGGNSLVNLFRRGGVEYGEVVRDVAKHLKVNFSDKTSAIDLEVEILKKIFTDSVAKMSIAEREQVFKELGIGKAAGATPSAAAVAIAGARAGGFATYKMAVIVANGLAKALLGRVIPFVYYTTLTKVINIAIGPIGWVITGLWTVADLASPAYRVTVPCVVQIAYMRQKVEAKARTMFCPSCNEANNEGDKFCTSCGMALATEIIASEWLQARATSLVSLAESTDDVGARTKVQKNEKSVVRKAVVKKVAAKKTVSKVTASKKAVAKATKKRVAQGRKLATKKNSER
jgi:uncharacterized protein YaaW (UPF0174 family)